MVEDRRHLAVLREPGVSSIVFRSEQTIIVCCNYSHYSSRNATCVLHRLSYWETILRRCSCQVRSLIDCTSSQLIATKFLWIGWKTWQSIEELRALYHNTCWSHGKTNHWDLWDVLLLLGSGRPLHRKSHTLVHPSTMSTRASTQLSQTRNSKTWNNPSPGPYNLVCQFGTRVQFKFQILLSVDQSEGRILNLAGIVVFNSTRSFHEASKRCVLTSKFPRSSSSSADT